MAAFSLRGFTAALAAALCVSLASAQTQPPANLLAPPKVPPAAPTFTTTAPPLATTSDARSNLKVTKGQGVLPNDYGQVWREYDISPYTLRVRDVTKPEQAVIDWVLRETGTEVWFSEPLGILNASNT